MNQKDLLEIANLAGFAALILFYGQLVLGSRLLVGLATRGVLKITKLHMWLGIWVTLLVLIHPILITIVYLKDWSWIFSLSMEPELDAYINGGKIAFTLFLILWISSNKYVRKLLTFRWWQRLHALSYVLVFFALAHSININTYLDGSVIKRALFVTLQFLLLAIILFRLGFWAGFFKRRYKITGSMQYKDNVLHLSLSPIGQVIRPKIAQYIYLQTRRFGEAHPFSIMDYNQQTGQIELLIKQMGNFTKTLSNKAIGTQVFLDGSYGNFGQNIEESRSKIFLAGGVGMSVFYEMVDKYAPNCTLINCANISGSTPKRQVLVDKLGANYYEYIADINGRITQDSLATIIELSKDKHNSQFYICGSSMFNNGIKQYLLNLGVGTENINIENFS
jgi:predicted ferric reductase